MSDWLSFLALAMSGIGIIVSLLARRDSSRSASASEKSADAAEKSAQEAKKASNIAQTDLLADHFVNTDYIFDIGEGKQTHGNHSDRSLAARQSAQFLKNIIQDDAFNKLLDEAISICENRGVLVFTANANQTAKAELTAQIAKASLLRQDYEITKRKCLYMKVG